MENTIKTGLFSRRKDITLTSTDAVSSKPEVPEIYSAQTEKYIKLNRIAQNNGIVLLGSDFFNSMPACELKQALGFDCCLYNRSFDGLTAADSEAVYTNVIADMHPSKILIQLGETDLERGFRSIPEIISSYRNLIASIRKHDRKCEIVIVSVCENNSGIQPEEFNKQLEKLADENKCSFADISAAFSNDAPDIKAFSLLKRFMRDRITFCEAMNMI
ncbi:hypothetical protein [Ruminococcus sp. HUN007]|uniref:hypothetical protein n=1 Tax=Ruminococcus sp. HUN007 TaxID=1514668 RepID=UPI0005D2D1D7|nr:hypothetical protein [Ruminococcus sp. HUN007]